MVQHEPRKRRACRYIVVAAYTFLVRQGDIILVPNRLVLKPWETVQDIAISLLEQIINRVPGISKELHRWRVLPAGIGQESVGLQLGTIRQLYLSRSQVVDLCYW